MAGIGVLDAIDSFNVQIETSMDLLVRTMLPNLTAFAGVIMSIFVAVKVIKSWLGEGEKLDTNTLVRPCLILAALTLYPTLVDLLMIQPVNIVSSIINNGGTIGDLTAMRDVMTHSQDNGGSDGGGVYDIIQIHGTLEFFHIILFFAASMVGGYVLFKQVLMKSIYYMLGPFALAFSLITGNESVVSKWFQGFFAVLLWVPVFDILRAIITVIPIHAANFSNADIIFSIAFQIVMVFAVLSVPEYANILVAQGESAGSKPVSQAAGMMKKGAKKAKDKAMGAMKKKKVAGSEDGGGRPKLERQNASKQLVSSTGGSSSGAIGGKGGKASKTGAAAKKTGASAKKVGAAALRAGGSAAQKAGSDAKRKLAFGGGKPGSSSGAIGGRGGRPKWQRQDAAVGGSSSGGSSGGGSSSGGSSGGGSSSGSIGGRGGNYMAQATENFNNANKAMNEAIQRNIKSGKGRKQRDGSTNVQVGGKVAEDLQKATYEMQRAAQEQMRQAQAQVRQAAMRDEQARKKGSK